MFVVDIGFILMFFVLVVGEILCKDMWVIWLFFVVVFVVIFNEIMMGIVILYLNVDFGILLEFG